MFYIFNQQSNRILRNERVKIGHWEMDIAKLRSDIWMFSSRVTNQTWHFPGRHEVKKWSVTSFPFHALESEAFQNCKIIAILDYYRTSWLSYIIMMSCEWVELFLCKQHLKLRIWLSGFVWDFVYVFWKILVNYLGHSFIPSRPHV